MDPVRSRPRATLLLTFDGTRRVFAAIGLIFVLSGITVTTLRLAGAIPPALSWHGPAFLILGGVGVVTARLGLRSPRLRPLALLAVCYGPWTVVGLLGDIRQGLWPLVVGEALGLALLLWALVSAVAIWARRRS